eukprot:TRINITY_DN28742_c0_g1_i1.p1 TRINITY_DN28742_c0_g1~~TRINITY_DN28742_c0_g1_i1.p1  ORF type:complete len:240 (+),score=26.60 TRINITY_DN28742_c0_g1_i1:72-791(+)
MQYFRRTSLLLTKTPFLGAEEIQFNDNVPKGSVWDLQAFRDLPEIVHKPGSNASFYSTKKQTKLLTDELRFVCQSVSFENKDINTIQRIIIGRKKRRPAVPEAWKHAYLKHLSNNVTTASLEPLLQFFNDNIPLLEDHSEGLNTWALFIGLTSNVNLEAALVKLKSLMSVGPVSVGFLNRVLGCVRDIDVAIRLFNEIVTNSDVTPNMITVDVLTRNVPQNDMQQFQRFMYVEWGLGTG